MGGSSSKMYYHSDAKAAQIDNMALTTNVLLIPYSIILDNKTYHNQPPQCCRGCGAALNKYSIIESHAGYTQKVAAEPLNDIEKAEEESKAGESVYLKGKFIRDLKPDEVAWKCEFCDVHNRLPGDTVLPKGERELYLIKKGESVSTTGEEQKEENSSADKTTFIFCIDVSGSMGCTHEVNKNGKVEYVSRMQLLQNALLTQLKEMKKTHPNRKVGIVLFGNEVTLQGDGKRKEIKLTTGLESFDMILKQVQDKGKSLIDADIGHNYSTLEKMINELEIGGGTALGPGLLSALTLAAQGETGSRIILCTDGLSNVGIGTLDDAAQAGASRAFYEKVGDMAVEKGVSVSIITVKGQACKVDALGPLTDRTAGQIIRVDPTNFTLANIAANNLIATDVKLRGIIHEGLSFKNEQAINLQNNNSVLVKHIGSISNNNEAYFEYTVKTIDELKQAELSLEDLESLPLQAQISYKDLKGNEYVFVASQRQKLTKDQKEAEQGLKADILAGYVQKQSANLVLEGKVEEARQQNAVWAQQMNQIANNADLNSENKQALVLFKEQNEQMQALINHQGSGNAVERDEVTSKLYEIKQQKQSK